MSSPSSAVVWFTGARKIPRLFGKLPSGEHIPGGPYRLSQVITFASIVVIGVQTMRWWGQWGLLDWIVLAGVAFPLGYAARWIPQTSLNVFEMAGGVATLLVGRGGWRRGGQVVTFPRAPRFPRRGPAVAAAPEEGDVGAVGGGESGLEALGLVSPEPLVSGGESSVLAARYAARLRRV